MPSGLLISLADLYLAYRKAKADTYYENTHFQAIAFTQYEGRLHENLRRLHSQLNADMPPWTANAGWLGGFSYVPKPIELPDLDAKDPVFFRCLDPIEDWKRQFTAGDGQRQKAGLRMVIDASVDFHIFSALWILLVGEKFDGVLDSNLSFGNRLRRRRIVDEVFDISPRPLNLECAALFQPYFSAYRDWRSRGLSAMRVALSAGSRIFAVTMDLQKFYHRVNPEFLLHPIYLNKISVELSDKERRLTELLISAIETWYQSTPDYSERPQGAIPVGLSASKVIANVLLAELDRLVEQKLDPIYYGRYVDDIFLVVRYQEGISSGLAFMQWIASQLPGVAAYNTHTDESALSLNFEYAARSELIFAGKKQKIFNLEGTYGLDLLTHIEEQIRRQSSEHRMLPELPYTAEEMASRALLAQPDGSLEPDALRKADVISVKRLGLALLLRDVECYARDLQPKAWIGRRTEFHNLVLRHVLTPLGFFNFFAYIHRAFGVMVACGDFSAATDMVNRVARIAAVLEETTTAGSDDSFKFRFCRDLYARAFLQVALQASTVSTFRWRNSRLMLLLRSLHQLSPALVVPRNLDSARRVSNRLLYADWGRRPYRDAWRHKLAGRPKNPPVPRELSILKVFRLRAVRKFRKAAGLHVPYWPAVVFPTRPLSLAEVTMAAPELLHRSDDLREIIRAFRGAVAKDLKGFGLESTDDALRPPHLHVYSDVPAKPRLAIPSFLTRDEDWVAAVAGKPKLDIERYERLRRVINRMLQEHRQPDYVIFPECSIPPAWAIGLAERLARRRISFIAGLECRPTAAGVRNDALISLTTDWPWYPCGLIYVQPKMAPAHDERARLWRLGKKRLYKANGAAHPPVYVHGEFTFGVLICSDLTTISHRLRFQGAIDALLVLEWNKDTETFEFLVESAAHDLHAYIVQVNNRLYGDSRIRVPAKEHYARDVVRVKGGLTDYFVVADLDIASLRQFQRKFPNGSKAFKPLPVGFKMSRGRAE